MNDKIYESELTHESKSIEMREFKNDITRAMDKYNIYYKMMLEKHDQDWADINGTYLMYPEKYNGKYVMLFRVPGATRGNIVVKEISEGLWEIIEFKFIDSTCFSNAIGCYEPEVVEAVKEFIGAKIKLPNA